MNVSPKCSGSRHPDDSGWQARVAAPPSECSPMASGSSLISGVQCAQIFGGVFNVAGPGSTNTTIHNYNYGPQLTAGDVLDILNSYALPHFRHMQLDTYAKATDGTCVWFTEGQMFQIWIKKGNILWGIGMPGAGKTILASIVIRYLEQIEKASRGTICVVYVYLRYSEPLAVRDILESLVKQIVERHADSIPIVQEIYAKHKREKTRLSQQDLMSLLSQLIKGKVVYIVLDALDELRSEDRPILIGLLASLHVKLFITSRPLASLQKRWDQAQVFDITADPSDIDLVIQSFLCQSPDLMTLLDDSGMKSQVVETIRIKAGGMFLHARLQLEALRHCTNIQDVEETMQQFPADIDSVYQQAWERILSQGPKHSNLAKLMLLWVTHADGEITIDTLRCALATSPVTHAFEPKRMVPETLLLSLCCGIVSVDDKTRLVRLIHYTTRDAILPRILEIFACPHAILAHVCIAHLIGCGFQEYSLGVPWEKDRDFMVRLRNDTLLAYAHRTWVHHTRQSHGDASIMAAAAELVLNCTAFPLQNRARVDFGGPLHVAAFYGLEHLIHPAAQLQSPNAQTKCYRNSPLMLAADRGHPSCTSALLSLPGIDVNLGDISGSRAVQHAIHHLECLQLIVEAPDIDVNVGDQHGMTALMHAVSSEPFDPDRGATKLLLGLPGIDINRRDKVGWTALIHAAHLGHTGAVKQLLGAPGIDVNVVSTLVGEYRAIVGRYYFSKQKYKNEWTALMIAAREGHIAIVKQLLNAPEIDVNVVSEPDGQTALSYASAEGHTKIVNLLLDFPGTIVPVSLDLL
ncbi:ankyrin repeat-containing domain protein [Coprinopsis sp. MPI-PUGE-AT-0042]|nr:ankyrin repeat-containing domain protein [Coprinopsis sp. MPI-PUGE-AT-0042]